MNRAKSLSARAARSEARFRREDGPPSASQKLSNEKASEEPTVLLSSSASAGSLTLAGEFSSALSVQHEEPQKPKTDICSRVTMPPMCVAPFDPLTCLVAPGVVARSHAKDVRCARCQRRLWRPYIAGLGG